MRTLYPPLAPHTTLRLAVGEGHELHVERCGTPGGIPVVFLHGGPGSGCKPDHRQFFDPRRYDIVLFDQRGAGRSTPQGGVRANDTWRLVADMETIRARFGLERWVLFGGSWGSTLALSYAQTHPQRVLAMVLRGSFLARRQDLAWFAGEGAHRLLPVQWQRFLDTSGLAPGPDLTREVHAAVLGEDETRAATVALAWESWSTAVVMYSLDGGGESATPVTAPTTVPTPDPATARSALVKARLEMHYARHGYFLRENQLLEDVARLPKVLTVIVHGARDITCPAEAAWALHRALPNSRLEILRTAGHLSSETPMIDALVRAADEVAAALEAR